MDLLATRRGRRLAFALLYLVEGAPIGFVWWALPTLLRERGVEHERIGALTGALVLPWALKFLWAPAIDVLRGPRWTRRAWVVASQALMVLTLLPLLWLDSTAHLGWLTAALVLHACAAATQDAAIDALVIASAGPDERGVLNGWMQAGMLLGRSALGGGALVLGERLGERAVVGLLLAVVAGGLSLSLLYRDPQPAGPGPGRGRSFRATLAAALGRRTTWVGLAFAATAGAGFEAVGGFVGPLLSDRGLSLERIGWFQALPTVAAMGLGALAGGWLADRVPRRAAVLATGLALGTAVLVLAGALRGAAQATALLPLLVAVYLGIGLFTAASYALFMDLTDPRLASTQFSAYMAATNLCESWSVRAAGTLVTARGYAPAFGGLQTVAWLGLALVLLLPKRIAKGPRSG